MEKSLLLMAITCDACGRRYEFTSHKDRCPVCFPEQLREDESDDYELDDREEND